MIFNLKKVVKKKNFGSLKNREGTIDNWGGGGGSWVSWACNGVSNHLP